MKKNVVKVLKELESRAGTLTAEKVVQAAENPRSPLHRYFEWNDQKAAARNRLDAARELLREYRIVITTNETTRTVRGYVHNPRKSNSKGGGYISVERLRDNKELAREMLANEIKRVLGAVSELRETASYLGVGEKEIGVAERSLVSALASLKPLKAVA